MRTKLDAWGQYLFSEMLANGGRVHAAGALSTMAQSSISLRKAHEWAVPTVRVLDEVLGAVCI